jgi:G:T-mismatch repair DNA endonuclease (very short patch repair protein)
MILCPMCSKELKNRRTLGVHLSRSHIFSSVLEKETILVYTLFGEIEVEKIKNEYVDEKYSAYELPIDIIKYLTLLGVKRTSKQERATERYKTNYKNSIVKKYGVDNISKIKSVQQKKEETAAKKYGSYGNYLSTQRQNMRAGYDDYVGSEKHVSTLLKQQETCLERYGDKNFGRGIEAKEKSKVSLKETIASWTYEERLSRTSIAREAVCHRGGYSSKPEKRVQKILIDLDVSALYNKHLWKYNWDMVIDKIIIEVQGTMWHAKPDRYKATDLIMGKLLASDIWAKDTRKQTKAKEEGYIVIEIWEDEINKRTDEGLTNLVKERLIENGYEF